MCQKKTLKLSIENVTGLHRYVPGTSSPATFPLLQKRWFVPVGKPLLSRFPNRERQSGTKGGALLSRVWQPGQKVQPAPTWLAHPFVPVGVTNRDKRSLFFMYFFSQFFFYFNYTFAFQLNLCIGIQYVWSPLIYIYSYLYNICPR